MHLASGSRPLHVGDVRLGAPVVWLGDDEAGDVLSPDRRRSGHVLRHGHPGRVSTTLVHHLQVDWLGLEDEPVSFAVGSVPDEAGRYVHLGLLTDAEWVTRSRTGWWASTTGSDQGTAPGPHQG